VTFLLGEENVFFGRIARVAIALQGSPPAPSTGGRRSTDEYERAFARPMGRAAACFRA
jgi:hypothetical protein